MNGGKFSPVQGLNYSELLAWISFGPNGTSDPAQATWGGTAYRWIQSITRTGVGLWTITFIPGFSFANIVRFIPVPNPVDLTNWFDAIQLGAFDPVNRTLVIQAHRSGTAQEVAANASTRVLVNIFAHDSTGR